MFDAKLKPAVFVWSFFLYPYRIGYWVNSWPVTLRIYTYRGAQSLGFRVSTGIVSNKWVRTVVTMTNCAINMLAKVNI